MTEEAYLRDLEAAAAVLSTTPEAYAELRALLAALPSGTAPDLRAGRTGLTAEASGAGGLGGGALTLQSGTPIGSESGIGQGIVQAQTIGLRNLLYDARFMSVSYGFVSLIGGALTAISEDFDGILDAGATGLGVCDIRKDFGIEEPVSNPMSSALLGINPEQWTAAGTATIKLKTLVASPAWDPEVLPYVVFSCTVYKSNNLNQLFSHATGVKVELVVRNAADNATLAISTPVDFLDLPVGSYLRMAVPVGSDQLAAAALSFQIWVTLTTDGAPSPGQGQFTVDIGNPQIELAPYQVPTLWLPEPTHAQVIARLGLSEDYPYAFAVRQIGDTGTKSQNRLAGGLSTAGEGAVLWGSGAATPDLRLRRSAAKTLTLDDNAGGAASFNFGQLRLSGIISPSQLTADVEDYNPTGLHTSSIVRLTANAWRAIGGLNAGSAGEVVILANVGTNPLTIVHEGGSSSAANRFASPDGIDYLLNTGDEVAVWYDTTSSRWRLLAIAQREEIQDQMVVVTLPISGTVAIHRTIVPALRSGGDILLGTLFCRFYVVGGTALSASHKWVGTYSKISSAGASTTVATITIDSGASSAWRQNDQAIGAFLNNGTTHWLLECNWVKTGTPGDLYALLQQGYRVI